MARVHRYVAHDGAWSETIEGAIRIGDTSGGEAGERTMPAAANSGAVSSIDISIDDVESTVGHDGDGIVGLQRWEIDETAAPAGNQRLWTGITDDRGYSTSPMLESVGGNVDIALQASDLNALLSFHRFAPDDDDANRPVETAQERFDAVMASDLAAGILVASATLVEIPDKGMDANKYHGSTLGDVLGDIGIQGGGLNHFVRHNEADDVDEVCIFDPNSSTLYSSTFRISNVDADIDDDDPATQTTFPPDPTPGRTKLTRSPAKVGSRIDIPWSKGTERYVRAATEGDFYRRDLQAPNATVKNVAKALDIAQDFAWKARGEDDVIDCTVSVPAAHVNDAREGQRIQVKFRHFRGYTDWRWVRIVERDPVPWPGSEAGYDVRYKLVPQGDAPPAATLLQRAFGRSGEGGADLSLANPVTIGSLLVVAVADRGVANPSQPNIASVDEHWGTGAWTKVPNNTAKITGYNDGVAFWVKKADSTSRTGRMPHTNANYGIWELDVPDADATIAGLTGIYVTEQADNLTMAIGSLGTPAVGTFAMLVCAWAEQTTVIEGPGMPAVDAGDFTVRHYMSAFGGGWILENSPYSVIADAEGDGGTLDATVVKEYHNFLGGVWCGAALLVTPA